MRKTAFTSIFNATSSDEAESLIKRLQAAGFHPAELALTATIPFNHKHRTFPVEVPTEEARKAKRVLTETIGARG